MAERDFLAMGAFRFFRNERLLTLGGRPLGLPAGAADLLALLLDSPGEEVDAAFLLAEVRRLNPQQTVDLEALAGALNDAFGAAPGGFFIASMDEDSFAFHGEVQRGEAGPEEADLPALNRDLVGRQALIAEGVAVLRRQRLLTLLGVGGVGKTSAAIAIAHAARAAFADGVCFVDLAPIRRRGALCQAVLLALGRDPGKGAAGSPEDKLLLTLAGLDLLLVLDNCEHLVEEAAALAELALRARGVRVLATSREPLRTFGESLLPVGPLDLPPPGGAAPDIEAARRFGAVALFMDHAAASGMGTAALQAEIRLVCDICRRLDGIPLALELAAAHAAALGLPELMQRLTQWPVASLGQAEAEAAAGVGRHRTLEATFDWSHELLSAAEKLALRRLAVFRGEFPFESALAVIVAGRAGEGDATAALLGLHGKSMLSVRVAREQVVYRLLETTRDYAAEKLRADPEEPRVRRAHAVVAMHRLQEAERAWSGMNGMAWLSRYGRLIDDVRQAVEWGLGESGDVEAATELVISALPLTSRLALFDESHGWLEQALEAVCRAGRPEFARLELQLLVSFRAVAAHTKRDFDALPGSDERILDLVEAVGDDRHTAGACMSVWFANMNRAHYAIAAAAAERQLAYAERRGTTVDVIDALKVAAYAVHYLGDQRRAEAYCLRALALTTNNLPASYYNVVGCDVRVSVRIVQTRVLWLGGRFREAAAMAREAMAMALEDRPLAVCLTLSYVICPLALWNGDLDAARAGVAQLAEWSAAHGLKPHQDWADWFGLLIARGESLARAELPAGLAAPDAMQADTFATLGCAWLVEPTAQRVAAGMVGWCAPEVLRRQGLALPAAGARECFLKAIRLAQAAGTAAWELRASLSLAGLMAAEGDLSGAGALISALDGRVDLSFDTADTRRARALLRELAPESA